MKTRLKDALLASLLTALVAAPPAASAADERPLAATVVTVYVSAHTGRGVAREVNELHAKMEKDGWKFAAFAPHMENGDTEGVWVTYTK
jgi:hypothetical protein